MSKPYIPNPFMQAAAAAAAAAAANAGSAAPEMQGATAEARAKKSLSFKPWDLHSLNDRFWDLGSRFKVFTVENELLD